MSEEEQLPDKKPSGLIAFWNELKRRKVMRVAIAYLAVAWLLIQIAATTFPQIGMPEWAPALVTWIFIIGFPIAVIIAWAFELTPDGIKTTHSAREERGDAPVSKKQQRKRNWSAYAVGAIFPTLIFGILAVIFYFRSGGNAEAGSEDKSIAILPLENLSPDPGHAYLASAIHNEILTNLANISNLVVIGRTSVLQYQDTVKTIQQIGEELDVRYLVQGSVFRDQNQASINIQLIDTETRGHIWGEIYDRNTNDLMSIRAAVAKDVAEQLHAALSPEEMVEIEKPPTDNPVAYDLYLNAYSSGFNTQALSRLQEATRLDPDFLEAWIRLNGSAGRYYSSGHRNDPDLLEIARNSLEQIERLAPDHSDYLFSKILFTYNVEGDLEAAVQLALERLEGTEVESVTDLSWRYLELGEVAQALPQFESKEDVVRMGSASHYRQLWCYQILGMWDEAERLIQKVLESDNPRNRRSWVIRRLVNEFLETGDKSAYIESFEKLSPLTVEGVEMEDSYKLLLRDFNQALSIYDQVDSKDRRIKLLYSSGISHHTFHLQPTQLVSSLIHFYMGDTEQKIESAETAKVFWEEIVQTTAVHDPDYWSNLAICYALMGDRESMETAITKVREETAKTNWKFRRSLLCEMRIAIAYLVLEEEDLALSTLEAASELESIIFLNRELDLWFIFDRLKGNPRFEALLAD